MRIAQEGISKTSSKSVLLLIQGSMGNHRRKVDVAKMAVIPYGFCGIVDLKGATRAKTSRVKGLTPEPRRLKPDVFGCGNS